MPMDKMGADTKPDGQAAGQAAGNHLGVETRSGDAEAEDVTSPDALVVLINIPFCPIFGLGVHDIDLIDEDLKLQDAVDKVKTIEILRAEPLLRIPRFENQTGESDFHPGRKSDGTVLCSRARDNTIAMLCQATGNSLESKAGEAVVCGQCKGSGKSQWHECIVPPVAYLDANKDYKGACSHCLYQSNSTRCSWQKEMGGFPPAEKVVVQQSAEQQVRDTIRQTLEEQGKYDPADIMQLNYITAFASATWSHWKRPGLAKLPEHDCFKKMSRDSVPGEAQTKKLVYGAALDAWKGQGGAKRRILEANISANEMPRPVVPFAHYEAYRQNQAGAGQADAGDSGENGEDESESDGDSAGEAGPSARVKAATPTAEEVAAAHAVLKAASASKAKMAARGAKRSATDAKNDSDDESTGDNQPAKRAKAARKA